MPTGTTDHTQSKTRTLLTRLFAGLFVLVVLLIGFVERAPLADAYHLATTHSPERYSELYFTDSTKLPQQIIAGRRYDIAVHVQNHEQAAKAYQLVAVVQVSGQPVSTQTARVQMNDGEGKDATFSFTAPQAGGSVDMVVQIKGTKQYIELRSKA